jgi:LeuA allosteric (dimerisation) domain
MTEAATERATLHLARWTCASGSNSRSRGAVVVESGEHRWQASAEGNGPVDALFRAVDTALHDVLSGHPRLVAYDVHALNEGSDSDARVTVKLAPPLGANGQRALGTYSGTSQDANIVAASVEAYLQALNELLSEEHWAGATDDAGNWRAVATSGSPRNEFDPSVGRLDAEIFDR